MRRAGLSRRADDACPGVVRPHYAADGVLVRVRVPGGGLTAGALRALAVAAREFGDGRIGLTSRGNLQVRSISEGDVGALARRLRMVGLLLAPEHDQHEHVRNIIASPLSGRGHTGTRRTARPGAWPDPDPAGVDVDGLVGELDGALRGRPALTALSGRFLFAVDDGTGDVAAQRPDVLAQALGAEGFDVRPCGCASGLRVRQADVVAAMLAVAEAFLAERAAQDSRAWRVAELTDGGARVLARMTAPGGPAENFASVENVGPAARVRQLPDSAAAVGLEPGLIEQRDGLWAVCAVVGLGLLEAGQAQAVAAAADLSTAAPQAALRITPWRRIVLRDLQLPAALAVRELLSSVGLVVSPGVGWSRVSACAGRPGCAKSLTDVQQDARAFAVRCDPVGPAVHWAGCERGCGTPSGNVVRILATAAGYRIEGNRDTADLSAADLSAADLAADAVAGVDGNAGRAR